MSGSADRPMIALAGLPTMTSVVTGTSVTVAATFASSACAPWRSRSRSSDVSNA
jgi:hypothetical protein